VLVPVALYDSVLMSPLFISHVSGCLSLIVFVIFSTLSESNLACHVYLVALIKNVSLYS